MLLEEDFSLGLDSCGELLGKKKKDDARVKECGRENRTLRESFTLLIKLGSGNVRASETGPWWMEVLVRVVAWRRPRVCFFNFSLPQGFIVLIAHVQVL
jgi:hypothetical protein